MAKAGKPYRSSLLKLFLLLAGVLIVCELTLRIFFSESLKLRSEPLVYGPSLKYGFLPVPGARGHFATDGVDRSFTLNNKGFIGPDFSAKKDSGRFRIIVVGFSNCEGYYVPYDSSCLTLLGNRLRQNGYNVELINCSIGGGYYRKIQQYRYLKDVVSGYDADLILFETGLPFFDYYVSREVYRDFTIEYSTGSADSRLQAQRVVDEIRSHPLLTSLYDHCYLVRALVRVYLRHDSRRRLLSRCLYAYANNKVKFQPENTLTTTYSIGRSVELLRALRDSLLVKGTQVVFFQIPDEGFSYRTQRFNDTLEEDRLPCLEITIDPPDRRPVWFKDIGHLNENGHRLLAESLYKDLVDGKYIPARAKEAQR